MSSIKFTKKSGVLSDIFNSNEFIASSFSEEPIVEKRCQITNSTGEHPLWSGYNAAKNYKNAQSKKRRSNNVRTSPEYGRLYVWLVDRLNAQNVVEFGTAFGASGMYWLSGLKHTGGRLFTFEPNDIWASFAVDNLTAISNNFTLVNGTFEENAEKTLTSSSIDIGFIDAIHTKDFVLSQLILLRKYMRPGGIVILDDVNFSDDMRSCWEQVSNEEYVKGSLAVSTRIGMIEV